jgi:phytoene synthase
MTERLLREAQRLYLRSEPGIADLPLACRPGIFAARHIYAGIGTAVRARGCDSITGRAHTGKLRKLGWLGLSGLRAGLSVVQPRMATLYAAPAPEVTFLIDAAAGEAPVSRSDTLIDALSRLRAQDLARRNAQIGMDQRSA